MSQETIQTSLHGRRIGLTSSGSLITNERDSTGPYVSVRMSTAGILVGAVGSTVETAAVVGTTLGNLGMSVLSTATATAATYTMAAPAKGLQKEIYVACSASEITIQGTATSILFGSTGGDKVFISGADNRSKGVILKGISATRWATLTMPTGGSITGG